MLLGRYSPPILDYTETAAVTTRVTDAVTVLRGASNWLGFHGTPFGAWWPAGGRLALEPLLVIATVAVAAFGLAGLSRSGMPHRRFLVCCLLVGVALVGFGHVTELWGSFGAWQRDFLAGPGGPLRNVHKFDVVLRLPLALGLAHLCGLLFRLAAPAPGRTHVGPRFRRSPWPRPSSPPSPVPPPPRRPAGSPLEEASPRCPAIGGTPPTG